MSYCRKEGKDIIIFATEEDHKEPSKVSLPEPEPQPGLIMPDGSINWNCPCLGGMATGPCGVEFREAFSCFHYSKENPKGSDCFESFRKMQTCMSKYPSLYSQPVDDDDIGPDFSSNDGDNKEMLEASKKSVDKDIENESRSTFTNDSESSSSSSSNNNISSSSSSSTSSNVSKADGRKI